MIVAPRGVAALGVGGGLSEEVPQTAGGGSLAVSARAAASRRSWQRRRFAASISARSSCRAGSARAAPRDRAGLVAADAGDVDSICFAPAMRPKRSASRWPWRAMKPPSEPFHRRSIHHLQHVARDQHIQRVWNSSHHLRPRSERACVQESDHRRGVIRLRASTRDSRHLPGKARRPDQGTTAFLVHRRKDSKHDWCGHVSLGGDRGRGRRRQRMRRTILQDRSGSSSDIRRELASITRRACLRIG